MQLSPDGNYLGFINVEQDDDTLFFLNLNTGKTFRVNDIAGGIKRTPYTFLWVGDHRAYYLSAFVHGRRYLSGVSAMDATGERWAGLAGTEAGPGSRLVPTGVVHVFDNSDHLLVYDVPVGSTGNTFRDVAKLNHVTGESKIVEKNPGNVLLWLADKSGQLRLAWVAKGAEDHYLYRPPGGNGWSPLGENSRAKRRWEPIGFDGSGHFYVSALNDKERWSVARLDPGTQKSETLFASDDSDLLSPDSSWLYGGKSLEQLVFALKDSRLLGIQYVTEKPRVKWIDPAFEAIQAEIDTSLPGAVNHIASFSRDESRFLILSFSDRDPGSYYLYERKTHQLQRVAQRMDWLKPEELAPMRSVKLKSRDSLTLHGFITLPADRTDQELPLVVLPHAERTSRDAWQFTPLVQFLANRGYAVLQVNYRGTPGYGADFFERGAKQAGRAIQDDITDAVRWAIAEKIADPKRVAILGEDFAGYMALCGLTKTPELYRCGIAMFAPVDWLKLIKEAGTNDVKLTYDIWRKYIGDPKTEAESLREISPVNFVKNMRAPVLLVSGEWDRVVPWQQTVQLIGELKKHRKDHEALRLPGEGHWASKEKSRRQLYAAIEKFLAKHMPSDPPQAVKGNP